MTTLLLAPALAQPVPSNGPGLAVDEIATMVHSQVPDRVIASTVRYGRVRSCLTWVDVALLVSEGIGPRALRATREHQCEGSVAPSSRPDMPIDDTSRARRHRRADRRAEAKG